MQMHSVLGYQAKAQVRATTLGLSFADTPLKCEQGRQGHAYQHPPVPLVCASILCQPWLHLRVLPLSSPGANALYEALVNSE